MLNIEDTTLRELSEDFGQLCGLQKAYINGWKNFVDLPESIGNLTNLEVLTLDKCELIHKLPPSIYKLTKLQVLSIKDTALRKLSEDFSQFVACKKLILMVARTWCTCLNLLEILPT